jgi:hypothetical protein
MLAAFNKANAKRGVVYSIQHKFPNDKNPKPKYCILMEDIERDSQGVIVIFTTSRLKFWYKKTCILVDDGKIHGIYGETLIDCSNWHELSIEIFNKPETEYLCDLPNEIMAQIDSKLEFIRKIDEDTLIRMLPN